LSSSERKLIAEGQPVIVEISVTEVDDRNNSTDDKRRA